MSATIDADAHVVEANKLFSRVLVGVDATPESRDALRQAALLKAPGGTITCLAAWNLSAAAGHAHDGRCRRGRPTTARPAAPLRRPSETRRHSSRPPSPWSSMALPATP